MLLGKKTFWYYVELPFLWIQWALTNPERRRPWAKVKIAAIPHKCRFEGKIFHYHGHRFQECIHDHCNTVNPLDDDKPQTKP